MSVEVTFCVWPRETHHLKRARASSNTNWDTTKKNMGRRQHPVCDNYWCRRRCDTKAGGLCRVCRGSSHA